MNSGQAPSQVRILVLAHLLKFHILSDDDVTQNPRTQITVASSNPGAGTYFGNNWHNYPQNYAICVYSSSIYNV